MEAGSLARVLTKITKKLDVGLVIAHPRGPINPGAVPSHHISQDGLADLFTAIGKAQEVNKWGNCFVVTQLPPGCAWPLKCPVAGSKDYRELIVRPVGSLSHCNQPQSPRSSQILKSIGAMPSCNQHD